MKEEKTKVLNKTRKKNNKQSKNEKDKNLRFNTEQDEKEWTLFCGDLANEITSYQLTNFFSKYKSLKKGVVINDNKTGKSKGYGFVVFSDPHEMLDALKTLNGKYIAYRPITLKRSKSKSRKD